MPPSSPIELDLFDFVDIFARAVKAGDPQPRRVVSPGDGAVVFCGGFFEQLFRRVLASPISGFDPASKRRAARLVEGAGGAQAVSPGLLALVTFFESFCDMYQDVLEGSYGSAEITYAEFHTRYLSRLIERALVWAREVPYEALADRIALAQLVYADAIVAMQW
ncbi:MAG: hypothetical protein ACRDZ8_19595 [Acidimicrobiales bacterium]